MTGNKGIKPIGQQDRNLGGMDFFLLWAGAAVSLAEIWAGGLLIPLGFAAGFLVILLGTHWEYAHGPWRDYRKQNRSPHHGGGETVFRDSRFLLCHGSQPDPIGGMDRGHAVDRGTGSSDGVAHALPRVSGLGPGGRNQHHSLGRPGAPVLEMAPANRRDGPHCPVLHHDLCGAS